MPKVKSHSIRGKRYKIKYVDPKQLQKNTEKGYECHGECDPPDAKNKAIRISNQLVGLEELRVIAHEAGHAGLWDLDEAAIDEFSKDLAWLLWRLGYRKAESE